MISIDNIKHYLRRLFYGRTSLATVTSHVLLAANIFIIVVSLLGFFVDMGHSFVYLEFSFGILFLTEYLLRFWVSRHKAAYVLRTVNMLDLFVIASLLMTLVSPNLAFLRVLRLFQLLRAYKLFRRRFDHHNEFVNRNFEIFTAVINMSIFLIIMSTIVFLQQSPINDSINTLVDATYFTIATLTTTGFGDIVVVGTYGRVISIVIMIFGVTLFFSLIHPIPRSSTAGSTKTV